MVAASSVLTRRGGEHAPAFGAWQGREGCAGPLKPCPLSSVVLPLWKDGQPGVELTPPSALLTPPAPPGSLPSRRALQGPLILAERCLVGWLGEAGLKVPNPARTTLALTVLLALAHHLFFLPAERMPLMQQFVEERRRSFGALAAGAGAETGGAS